MENFQTLPIVASVSFEDRGRNYEIRIFSDGYVFSVKAFTGNVAANGFLHSVTLPVAVDLKHAYGVDAVAMLIEDAKRDILENRWEKFAQAWKQR
jgi:hypothetical protein